MGSDLPFLYVIFKEAYTVSDGLVVLLRFLDAGPGIHDCQLTEKNALLKCLSILKSSVISLQ